MNGLVRINPIKVMAWNTANGLDLQAFTITKDLETKTLLNYTLNEVHLDNQSMVIQINFPDYYIYPYVQTLFSYDFSGKESKEIKQKSSTLYLDKLALLINGILDSSKANS